MKEVFRHWLVDENPDIFITFNFGYTVKPLNGEPRIHEFCKRIERKALGRKWCRLPRSERLTLVGCWERIGPHLNTHCHLVGWAPAEIHRTLQLEGPQIWEHLVPRGQLHFEHPRLVDRVVNYVTKELPKHTGDGFDRLSVY